MTAATAPIVHSTFNIERSYSKAVDKVWAAFADKAKKRRWFAEGEGFIIDHYDMDFSIGGIERASFRTQVANGPIAAGTVFKNFGTYYDIVPNKRIVLAYTMAMGGGAGEPDKRFSASLASFEFAASKTGTTLLMTEQGAYFEGADGAEMRKMGWTSLADALGKELETH